MKTFADAEKCSAIKNKVTIAKRLSEEREKDLPSISRSRAGIKGTLFWGGTTILGRFEEGTTRLGRLVEGTFWDDLSRGQLFWDDLLRGQLFLDDLSRGRLAYGLFIYM